MIDEVHEGVVMLVTGPLWNTPFGSDEGEARTT